MALPANIRVNVRVPFPTLVQGSGPTTVTKANGIWTVGFSIAQLTAQAPALSKFPTDYVIVWDAVSQSYFKMALSVLLGLSVIRIQRSIRDSGDLPIQAGDSVLNVNAVSDLAPALPNYTTRAGAVLTFHLVPGSAAQTITGGDGNQIDGNNTILIAAGTLTLVPYNDGANAGWAVE